MCKKELIFKFHLNLFQYFFSLFYPSSYILKTQDVKEVTFVKNARDTIFIIWLPNYKNMFILWRNFC